MFLNDSVNLDDHNRSKRSTTTELEFLAGNVTTTPYPDIITSYEPEVTTSRTSVKQPQPTKTNKGGPYNMDALIIGIVGGVVAFIAIIIIYIVCVAVVLIGIEDMYSMY